MKFKGNIFFLLGFLLVMGGCGSPQAVEVRAPLGWESVKTPTNKSIRGLSPITEEIIWVSGEDGLWMRTVDGGQSWNHGIIGGLDSVDFRDIVAFDAATAIAVSNGQPAVIYKTTDGGKNWDCTYQGSENASLKGIAFTDDDKGYAYGDPIDGQWLILKTLDGGKSWIKLSAAPAAEKGKVGYSASVAGLYAEGSNIWLACGGNQFHIYLSKNGGGKWKKVFQDPVTDSSSQVIFALQKAGPQSLIGVGGDFNQPDSRKENLFLSLQNGQEWRKPTGNPPSGYRTGVIYFPKFQWLITVGTNGSDFSKNGGDNWERFSNEGFHSVKLTQNKGYIWASGNNGKLARLEY